MTVITIEEARSLLEGAAPLMEIEEVDLADAAGRVLAEPIVADRDLPPTDRSGMDGFAVRTEDLPEPDRILRVAGEIRAGQPVGKIAVGEGEAVRIMTGAIVPPGADAVVMVELTEEDPGAGTVRIRQRPEEGQHIRLRAEDVTRGETILDGGRPIHAAEIAALASVGMVRVKVRRRPQVNLLSTGDEIVPATAVPADHQVRNSNSPTLANQLAGLGLAGRDLGTVLDEAGDLDRVLGEGLKGDVLLLTGGVSMGDYDLVREALERAGVETVFHKVSVRPGKPILVGRRDRCLVIGLPGNPVSAFTGFFVFVAPTLRKMMGYARHGNRTVTAVLDEPLRPKPGRTTYHLARVEWRNGGFRARQVRTMGSGDVVSMVRANAFLVTPPGPTIPAGETVPSMLWPDDHLR
jgi:molybdopterin molybdotransferase